jgi:hypothetical protein
MCDIIFIYSTFFAAVLAIHRRLQQHFQNEFPQRMNNSTIFCQSKQLYVELSTERAGVKLQDYFYH